MNNPALARIMYESSANLPIAGTIYNTNRLLGTDDIVGIKTGNTDQAGGCFLFAAKHTVQGKHLTIVGGIMSAPNLDTAELNARTLLASVDKNFKHYVVVPANMNVGAYTTKWGQRTTVATKSDVSLLVWQGQPVTIKETLSKIKLPIGAHKTVGRLSAIFGGQTASVQLINKSPLKSPTTAWRLVR